ncbi:hypothetical protein ABFS83_09G025100 [Erythranthe nasuta]
MKMMSFSKFIPLILLALMPIAFAINFSHYKTWGKKYLIDKGECISSVWTGAEDRGDYWCEDECNDYRAFGICDWQLINGFLAGPCQCWL